MSKAIIFTLVALIIKSSLFAQISNEQAYKFNRVMDLINMFYVDTVQENKLIEKAIISVLKELDPHSIYVSKEEVDELNEPLIGSFDGIGITYNILHDTVYIISTYPGGPSERAGIKAGDRIISIDEKIIAGIGINSDDVKKHLLGSEGTKVMLRIKPYGQSDFASYSIAREQIPIHSIDASYQVNQSTGYIKLNKFSANSLEEFKNAAKKLKKEGVDNLILDLRDNGGGYLKSAIDIADQFLSDKKLIVYTSGSTSPKTEYFSEEKGIFEEGRLIILIDEGSASASEIVCGAIQDWDKGLLVGRRSFGKGLVQRPFTLMDGSMIRLTIARYYTPTGRLIQRPYSDGYDKYSNDLKKRIEHGELFTADSIQFADSLEYHTMNLKRKVYGGGGIMPDIFVPLDTTIYPKYYQKMMNNGKLFEFVIDYIDKNRILFNQKYLKFTDFKNNFQISDDLLKKLVRYAIIQDKEQVFNENDLLANKTISTSNNSEILTDYQLDNIYVKNHLKALIAQNIYSNSEYYEIINNTDKVFQKAFQVINNENEYRQMLHSK